MKVVIVGGVAGGATAAARIRRLDEQAEIVVFERSGFVSYANCGLPYYIGDVITDPEELTLQTPESFFSRFRVIMKVRHEVTAIHPNRKTVSVKNLETGENFEESYDKLILSPGAKPTQPRLPGVGLDKLFTLRTVEDTFRIKEYINTHHPKSVVLAGGGFIGLELAENLRELGMEVTIVQRPKQLMNPFLLDARTPVEYAGGHMEGFRNIPLDDLRDRLDEIEPGKPVYVTCQSGLRSYIACRILEANGHEAYNFAGGFRFYDAVVNDRALIEKAYSCGMDQ
ncbi:MAG: FAD-dependent oxidoreductase [Oscillospiraceae bacterium]|nr:FAD-dependent oxidoreductase [Oscillospiraceae bacterium]